MSNRIVARAMEKHFGVKPKHQTDPKKAEHGKRKKGKKDADDSGTD